MNRAVFLDRDGTIIIDKGYLFRPEDMEFLPGVTEALHILQGADFLLIVCSNQSGIARGYFSEKDYQILTEHMTEALAKNGVRLTATYFCPHHPMGTIPAYTMECDCRKPKTGMFVRAAMEHEIDLDRSFAVGDRLRDLSVCRESGCQGYLIGESESPSTIDEIRSGKIRNVEYQPDLLHCATQILNRM